MNSVQSLDSPDGSAHNKNGSNGLGSSEKPTPP
jgi:hypothetical protein